MENLETLNDFYSMDMPDEQFLFQNFYSKFEHMSDNGEAIWSQIGFEGKKIVLVNPYNGLALAVLKDSIADITVPNHLPTCQENLLLFESLWEPLDYNIGILMNNIRSHATTDEYCCLDCNFPFSPVCSELYSKFAPG